MCYLGTCPAWSAQSLPFDTNAFNAVAMYIDHIKDCLE